jgi:hypothetical protein
MGCDDSADHKRIWQGRNSRVKRTTSRFALAFKSSSLSSSLRRGGKSEKRRGDEKLGRAKYEESIKEKRE